MQYIKNNKIYSKRSIKIPNVSLGKNISNEFLKEFGYLPLKIIYPKLEVDEMYDDFIDEVLEDKVVRTYQVKSKPPKSLEMVKEEKIKELHKAKKEAQNANVTVRDNEFFGGRENGQKYDEAYRLAKMMGQKKGVILGVKGFVEVDETYMQEILVAIGGQSYASWFKFNSLKQEVESLDDIDQINLIKWEEE